MRTNLGLGPFPKAGVQSSLEEVWVLSTGWRGNVLVCMARSVVWLLGKQEVTLWNLRGCAAIAGHVEMQRYGVAGTAEGLEHVVSMLGGP